MRRCLHETHCKQLIAKATSGHAMCLTRRWIDGLVEGG